MWRVSFPSTLNFKRFVWTVRARQGRGPPEKAIPGEGSVTDREQRDLCPIFAAGPMQAAGRLGSLHGAP